MIYFLIYFLLIYIYKLQSNNIPRNTPRHILRNIPRNIPRKNVTFRNNTNTQKECPSGPNIEFMEKALPNMSFRQNYNLQGALNCENKVSSLYL